MDNEIEIFFLEHIYEKENEDEIKFIGVFSSQVKAQEAINELILKPGFRYFPLDCFHITNGKLNRIGWPEGFTSCEEAMNGE